MLRKLTAEEALRFKVPASIANDEKNIFISRVIPPYGMYGPWPLLSFTFDQSVPNFTTFHAHNLNPEYLDYEPFNPLDEEGGMIYLDFRDIPNLVGFMKEVYLRLSEKVGAPEDALIPITKLERLKEFHLKALYREESNRELLLEANTSTSPDDEPKIVLLLFSTGLKESFPTNLYFRIMNFPHSSLEDPDFIPLDHSKGNITLGRRGLMDLSKILEKYQHYPESIG